MSGEGLEVNPTAASQKRLSKHNDSLLGDLL